MLTDLKSFFGLMKKYLDGQEAITILGAILGLVFGVVGLAAPFITQFLIDVIFIKGHAEYLLPLLLISAGVLLVMSMTGLGADYLLVKAFERANLEIKLDLFNKLQAISVDFFTEKKSGEITYRLLYDTNAIEDFFAKIVINTPINILILLVAGIYITSWNATLSFFVFLVLLLQAFVAIKFRKPLLNISLKQKGKEQEISGLIVEQFRNIQLIKALHAEQSETQKFKAWLTDLMKINIAAFMYTRFSGLTVTLVNNLWSYGVLLFGGMYVISGKMSLGTLMATLLMTGILYPRVTGLIETFLGFQDVRASLRRFFEYYNIVTSVIEKEDAIEFTGDNVHISIENLSFGYYNNELILEDINFEIEPRSLVAIVGKSGVGKTTLCKLLVRFYDPTGGAIKINNINIKDISLKSLRRTIYYVPQNQFLFSGSIFENITYGLENISIEQVTGAAKKAAAHDFITKLFDGYYTQVGESGVKLSAGEAQRIALARAFLLEPKVVILDEPTSFIDVETEDVIRAALQKLKTTSTVIVVTHNLQTMKAADRVIVFEEGRANELDVANELFGGDAFYTRIVREILT
ncbi:MAG: ABC transporter ATP-binding protein [Actinomycetota bacterium]